MIKMCNQKEQFPYCVQTMNSKHTQTHSAMCTAVWTPIDVQVGRLVKAIYIVFLNWDLMK